MNTPFTFTDRDLQILTNFSEISSNIGFKIGRKQSTCSTRRNIFAQYEFDTEIKEEFCIYDLKEFLSLNDLLENPIITLNQNHLLLKENKTKFVYPTIESKSIIQPNLSRIEKNKKIFNEKDNDIEFDLTAEDVREIYRLNRKIKQPDLVIENEEGNIVLKLFNRRAFGSRSLITLNHTLNQKTNRSFKIVALFNNLKILISNYEVAIKKFGNSGIMKLSSKEIPLTYWIALEEDSIFDSNESEVNNNA